MGTKFYREFMKKIALASDHAGFELKEIVKRALQSYSDVEVQDLGPNTSEEPVDYPDYARKLAKNLVDIGILICGSGIGMSIAANRFKNVRAALCTTPAFAKLARAHNDANVLVLPGRFLKEADAKACIEVFLNTPFDGGRHQQRVEKLSENGYNNDNF